MVELIFLFSVLVALAYFRAGLLPALVSMVVVALLFSVTDLAALPVQILSWFLVVLFGLLSLRTLRQNYVSEPILSWFRKLLPALSQTEQEALEAGTVWWDAELFSGQPEWKKLLNVPKPELSKEEQAFLDGPVETVCKMLDTWQIESQGDLPAPVWQFLKEQRFFGMIISKEYGGLEFSALGNAAVVMKLASHNLTAAVTVMVPNSLGPGELLAHYGTQQQRDSYLPRLASGDEIPCFALTSPTAGSDASAMPDTGVICKGQWQGQEIIGLRLNWNKRYITLAPVATVIGLAFRTLDPDHLLSEKEDLGISCALIPVSTPGVSTGTRHRPLGSAFMNGPTRGDQVFVPLDYVIGAKAGIGEGWLMLMHSLAAGRAISLPALGVSGSKLASQVSGEYARIRKQFGLPIAYFEGIEEPLARIAGNTYRMEAARLLTMSALKMGEKPSVLSAILKYQMTEGNRQCINDAMDIHGGKGIMQGPNNYLASFYQALPIAITVEGANILTRSLIVFGQGAIRNHPWLLKEMQAAQAEPSDANSRAFDEAFFSHIGYTTSNFVRAWVMGLTGARLVKAPVDGRTAHYYRQLTRMSAAFAFVSDLVLLLFGGSFKFKEKISGRLADALSHLYIASAVLKQFEDDGCPKDDHALVHWAMRDSLVRIQDALINTLRNFPAPWLGQVVKWLIFPLGHPYKVPSDTLGKHVAQVLITRNPARERLLSGIYRSDGDDATGLLHRAFEKVLDAAPVEKKLKQGLGVTPGLNDFEPLVVQGVSQGIISAEEGQLLQDAMGLVSEVIQVDEFPRDAIETKIK